MNKGFTLARLAIIMVVLGLFISLVLRTCPSDIGNLTWEEKMKVEKCLHEALLIEAIEDCKELERYLKKNNAINNGFQSSDTSRGTGYRVTN